MYLCLMKLTIRNIKKLCPDYFDSSKLNGVSLTENAYSISTNTVFKEYYLLTNGDNPMLKILSKYFNIVNIGHFYLHWNRYVIRPK